MNEIVGESKWPSKCQYSIVLKKVPKFEDRQDFGGEMDDALSR